jgi:hypothetical protein
MLNKRISNMAKKSITKISDKLVKVNESFTVNTYDNGFMIEVGGRDREDNWSTVKLMVTNVDDLVTLIRETVEMEISN